MIPTPSDTEAKFILMAKMALSDPKTGVDDILVRIIDRTMIAHRSIGYAKFIERNFEMFPIVASTFEALTIERPELREHYDRAKEAWEASQ